MAKKAQGIKAEKRKLIKIDISILKERARKFIRYIKWPVVIILIACLFALIINIDISHIGWNWSLILQYIAVLKWPIITLIVLAVFYPHIPVIVKRMKKLSWSDKQLEFESGQEQPTTPTSSDEQALKVITEDSVTVSDTAAVTSTPPVPTPNAAGDGLLASEEVQLLFERIYRSIYGTQFAALKELQNYPDGLNESDLLPFLNRHQQITQNAFTDVLSFMSYVASYLLVSRDPTTRIYKITQAGKLFLNYFSEVGALNFKPF